MEARWYCFLERARSLGEAIMNRLASVMAALLAGVAIGAMGINGLRAQNKAPAAYFIADISEISNPAAFSQGIQKVGAVIVASAGHYLARSDNIVSLTGMPPKRFVMGDQFV